MIKAEIVADSISPQGHRITTLEVIMPRIILAEFNTHRMFSRNSASSRAIPFQKMLQMVLANPFIPIAWQKNHKGMQGTEYLGFPANGYAEEKWLEARDEAVRVANYLHATEGVTKQLANRLLEPFMYHKVLCTSTEWENFFALRCPQYDLGDGKLHRSRKDALKYAEETLKLNTLDGLFVTDLDWLKANKGQAEIHMMAVAEAIWDAMNESTPKQLKAGEWHIPYEDKIDLSNHIYAPIDLDKGLRSFGTKGEVKIKIATAMAARVSYTTVGEEKEVKYENLIGVHDRMKEARPFHASPFEHCAQCMDDEEYETTFLHVEKVKVDRNKTAYIPDYSEAQGWCRNFRGWKQYRYILENEARS